MMMKKYYLLLISFCCSAYAFSQAPGWDWAAGITAATAPSHEYGQSVVTDPDGNVYVTGSYGSATITLGGNVLTNANTGPNQLDIFIAKYNSSGNLVWVKTGNGVGFDYSYKIVIDNQNNLYITGWYESPVFTLDSITLTNPGISSDIFVAKYDSAGNIQWATRAGGDLSDLAYDIAVDNNQNTYIAGNFYSDTSHFGNSYLVNAGGWVPADAFVAKLDASGTPVWARAVGSGDQDYGSGVAVSPAGDVYVTGSFQSSSLNLGNGITLTNTGSSDAFVVKYDNSGNSLWARSTNGSSFEAGANLVTDNMGNLYFLGGYGSTTMTFGTLTFTNTGNGNGLVAKIDPAGNVIWGQTLSTVDSLSVGVYTLTTDQAGGLYVSGFYNSASLTIGNTTLMNQGGYDPFIAKYDYSGNAIWAQTGGTPSTEIAYAGFGDAGGEAYITGHFDGPTLSLGGSVLTNTGGSDYFLAKLSPGLTGTETPGLLTMSVYPNPSNGMFRVNFPYDAQQYRIMDITGKMVQSGWLTSQQFQQDFMMEKEGIYIIEAVCGKRIITEKIIVTR